MVKNIIQTGADFAGFILRLLLGIVFSPHDAQKVFE
jgi:hypothetical protein